MNETEPRFISLVSDTTFKYLWKNERTRKWFNEIIMDKIGIDLSNFELVDNESNSGSSIKDQRNDIALSDLNNEIVIVEMNSTYSEGEERKYRYYLYRRAGNNYLKGKEYTDRKHTLLIAFNNYLRPNMPDEKIIYSWFGDHDHNINYKDIEMYEIFLPKYYDLCYHESNKIDKRLCMFGAKSYDEMKKTASNKDDLYIVEELIRLGKMDEFIDEYDYEIVRQKLINTYKIEGLAQGKEEGLAIGKEEGLAIGKEEGLKLGRAEGRAEGEKSKQIEIAKKMLEKNSDINFIFECTGLSIHDIEKLKV